MDRPFNEIQKMAALYRDALKNEFSWYHYRLTYTAGVAYGGTIWDTEASLQAIWRSNMNFESIDTVFEAEFLPDCIEIKRHYWPVYCVKYADPWFTEDILSRILREHTNHTLDIYKDVRQKDRIFC